MTKTPKKILLIPATSDDERKVPGKTPPSFMAPSLGVLRMVGFLKARGHDAVYFDTNLRLVRGDKGGTLEKMLEREPWDIIGVSVLEETLLNDIQNLRLAKKICPSATIVAGGMEAQFNYQTILDKSPCDIVVQGEGEVPLFRLAEGMPPSEIPGAIVKNRAENLNQELFDEATDALEWEGIEYEPYWDYWVDYYKSRDQYSDQMDIEIHTVRVFARNRCPIGCRFCISTFQLTAATGGNVPVISSTDENLVNVVRRIVDSHPRVRTIYFTDDDFCINKKVAIRTCEKLSEQGFGDLTFMCFARITDITEELVIALKKANFRLLFIGIESFSEEVLDELGKRCEISRVYRGLEILQKHDLSIFFNVMMTTPASKLVDVQQTVRMATKYFEEGFFRGATIPAVQPVKGTPFEQMHCDFKSKIVPIEGTDHHLRVDDMIWPEDPLVRELLRRYLDGVDQEVDTQMEKHNIIQRRPENMAMFELRFMQQLLDEMREESPEAARQLNSLDMDLMASRAKAG